MINLIYIFLLETLIYFLLNSHGLVNSEVLSIVFVFVNIIYISVYILLKKKEFKLLFLLAFYLRVITMIVDVYFRDFIKLYGSGADSEGFLRTSILISRNLSLLKKPVYGGIYTKFLGIIIFFTSENRLILHYINVLLGLLILFLVHNVLLRLNINRKFRKISLIILSFFPISVINSGILLRENFIIFFILYSFNYFIKWFQSKNNFDYLISVVLLIPSIMLHSGTISILLGYFYGYIFYDRKKNRTYFTWKSFLYFLVSIIIVLFVNNYSDVFLSKFSKLDNVSDLADITVSGSGGSVYLTGVNIKGPISFVLFTPIKIIYFLGAPMPWNWRGSSDIISFVIDGSVYLYLIYSIFKNRKRVIERNYLLRFLSLSLISFLIVFGIGINNAGTAMRHRNKIFPLILILWTSLKDQLYKEKINFKREVI